VFLVRYSTQAVCDYHPHSNSVVEVVCFEQCPFVAVSAITLELFEILLSNFYRSKI